MRRVVVTGLGTINPLGNDVESSWNSLINSKSGISKISKFNVDNYPCKIAGSIDDFLISEDIVSQRDQRKIDRFITLGLIAADEAIKDSGFVSENERSFRYGVMVGSGIGGLDTIYRNSSILDNKGNIVKQLNRNEAGNIELEIPLIKSNKNKNDLIFFSLLITYLFIFFIYKKKKEKK